MALFLFAEAILEERPLSLFNGGEMERDFTYIDDAVDAIVRIVEHIPNPDPTDKDGEETPFRVYNVGSHSPVSITKVVTILEELLGRKATKNLLPMQPGDVPATYADINPLWKDFGFKPKVSIEDGIAKFVEWYKEFRLGKIAVGDVA